MTDQNNQDTGNQQAQGDGQQGSKGDQEGQNQQQQYQIDPGLKDYLEKAIPSWVGRVVKKQIDENVMPHLKREEPNRPTIPAPDGGQGEALKAYNEKLLERMLGGDVLGAFQDALNVHSRAKETLTKNQTKETDKLITSYSEKPFYKDIHSEMDKFAKDAVGQGVPPEWAVEHAYQKALASHLVGNHGNRGDGEGGNLDMLGGGKPPKKKTDQKLPEAFKAAAARDIAAGLFKDEKDYIAHLSPQIKKQYGLE